MRELYEEWQWVIYAGKRYQVDYDYEDLIYLKGRREPVKPSEVKRA